MQIGVISDIHANKVALDAVFDDMPPVDAVICAGDIVGYNPWPSACIDRIRERGIPTVMGNHDRLVATNRNFHGNSMAQAGVTYAQSILSQGELDWLRALPTEQWHFDDRVRVAHGHPNDPDHYTFPDEFSESLLGSEQVLVLGHTHVQYHEAYPEGIVMNPGSVGQPRDGDPQSAYAILDLSELSVTEHRTPYDIDAVQAAIRDAGLPERTGARLETGR